jgi:hypothetical protein
MKNDLIEFNIAVAECKVIIAKNSKNFLRLGEIGATVETIHGDSTLKKLAKEAGLTYSSLRDYVSVWKAFDLTTVVGRPTFSALAALVNHPDRQALIAGKPTMTSDEARKIARGYKASISPTKTADDKIAAAWGRVDHSLDSMLKAADGSEHVAEISDFIKTVSRFKTVLGPKIVKAVKPEPVPYIDERTVKAHVQLAMLYEKEDPEYYADAQREILAATGHALPAHPKDPVAGWDRHGTHSA